MPTQVDSSPPPPLPVIERWIEAVRRPPSNRLKSVGIITALILGIGFIDYLTDVSVSLIFFYLIPISLSVMWGDKRWAMLTSIICIIVRTSGDLVSGGYFFSTQTMLWNRLTNFANYLVVIYAVDAIASIHNRLEQKVAARTQELQRAIRSRNELQAQLLEVGLRERAAVGHELHDELCQELAAANIALDLLGRDLKRTKHGGEEIATAIQAILRKSIAQTKEIAYNLLSSEVKPEKLVACLHEMSERLGRKTGHTIHFHHHLARSVPNTDTSSHLFYIAREATMNAVKHARADLIGIHLRTENNQLRLEVEDNGVGMESTEESEHAMGLRIMTHRASLIGAELSIESRPQEGTRIVCCLTLP